MTVSDLSALSPLTNYPVGTRAAALRRFQFLRAHLEDGVPLTALALQHEIPLRTMQHWLRQYRQHGLAGLCRQPRRDRSTHRLDPQLVQFIEGLALRTPPPSAATVYRQLIAIAPQHGWPSSQLP